MTTETYIGIQHALAEIIKGTEWEGHVYLVGGCVRDELMHHEIHDVDIAVTRPNGGIRFAQWLHQHRLLARNRRPLTFEHFGTAKFRLRGYPFNEIDSVQTRKGRYVYEEEPHPLENFGTIEEDAQCRDLTINSLYRNITTGELLDPTGKGLSDIEAHVIRTPNVPDISLRDNPMHILRCIRFAVKYGWDLNDDLIESMKRNLDILEDATMHRMTKELNSILTLRNHKQAFDIISLIGAMTFVEPYIEIVRTMREQRKAYKKQRYKRPKPGTNKGDKANAKADKKRNRKKRKNNNQTTNQ